MPGVVFNQLKIHIMKTRNLLFFIFIASFATVFSQSAEVTYSFSSESDLRTSPGEIVVRLTGDTLRSEVGSVDADAVAFLAGMTGGSAAWNTLIGSLDASNITLEESDSVARISIPVTGSYYISDNETITFVIPSVSLLSGGAAITATPDIVIVNEDPVISIVSESYTEAAIRNGSINFDITVTGDIWTGALSSDFANRIVSGGVWDSQVTPSLTVTRTDDNTVTVTIPAIPAFEIVSTETVEVSVLATDLQYTVSGVFLATGVKTISPEPVTVTGSATFDGVGEGDIRTSSYQIILTLDEDDWVPEIGTNHASNRDLIRGLTFSASQDELEMENAILAGDFGAANTSVSGNTVTIDVPAVPGFDITSDAGVSYTVPAVALTNSSSSVSTGIFATINRIGPSVIIETVPVSPINSSDLDGATLNVKLSEETWDNSTFNRTNFSFGWVTPNPAVLSIASNGDIVYVADDEINITLSFTGTISENNSFNMTVAAAELSGTSPLTSPSPGVSVIAIIEPVITSVSIPNVGMGIGETVDATLTVNSDDGQPFTLLGGTIAGRTVYDLNRLNEFTYTVKFDIGPEDSNPQYTAGDAVPYTDLQLQNGTLTGLAYSGSIIQDGDPIDTERPDVTLVSINNGNYKVGETLVVTIQSPEADLTFNQSIGTVNTVPLTNAGVTVHNAGSGIYQVSYRIEEGQPDVVPPNQMPISLILTDRAGNNSIPVTSYTGIDPVIDANSPVISTIDELTSGIVIPGDDVVYAVTAGEAGLTPGSGTTVNNVGMGSGRVSLVPVGGNSYELIYTVGPSDMETMAGDLDVSVILKDAAGNETTYTGIVTARDVSVVTSTPQADIFGGGSVCAGDSTQLFIPITGGTAPYEVILYEDGTEYGIYTVVGNDLVLWVSPTVDRTYLLHSVKDALGLTGFFSESIDVTVHPLPAPQFSPTTRKVFSSEGGGSYQLIASPLGGVFSGPGVVPSEGRFYPAIAGVTDTADHEIVYTYQDENGCIGRHMVYFTVLPTSGGLTISYPDPGREGIICYDDPMFEIAGSNVDGLTGSFMLYVIDRTTETPVPGAIVDPDPNDNRAFIDPSLLEDRSASYKVTYEYIWKSEIVVLEALLEFDFIRDISFSKAMPVEVCRDAVSVALEAAPNTGGSFVFSGPGVFGNEVLGFTFEPSLGDIGKNTIEYSFTSNAGCFRSDQIEITNFDVPDVQFAPEDVCIPPAIVQTGEGGGPIGFVNETTKPELISSWMWEFGDINSGPDNFDTIPGNGTAMGVIHNYSAPGNRSVSLKVTTYNGCTASRSKSIEFADKPSADFRVVSDCWIPGEPVEFKNYSNSEKAWESFTWNINNQNNSWDTTIVTLHKDSLAKVFFNNIDDIYEIQLVVRNVAGTDLYCEDVKQDYDFVLKPTQRFEADDSRFMTFDEGAEKWTRDSSTKFSSWKWGVPEFYGYEAPAGDRAWFTSVYKDTVLAENSWIQSECYDFRNLERPMVRMDVMRSFDRNRDGAVIQYTLDNGATWNTLGNIGEGINWYNSFEIANRPGGGRDGAGSSIGWSGEDLFTPDTGWVTVAHDLDILSDERLVIFGIFYATDGASVIENQGFAVDNIYIGERTKRGLIEHFTNSGDPGSVAADNTINSFVEDNELDMASLHYHMPYPGEDQINENNPAPASARSFYYGITQVPFALMDGGIVDEYRYDFAPSNPSVNQLKKLTLERPAFDMDLKFQLYSGHLSTNVEVTAFDQIDSAVVILHVAVVEKEVTSDGGMTLRNVVLDLLPSAAGTVLPFRWDRDETVTRQFSWAYKHVGDEDDLMLVAFLQDRETGKVLQVVTSDESVFPLHVREFRISPMKVYPNPAKNILHIERDDDVFSFTTIEISDLTGRVVMLRKVEQGDRHTEIDISELSVGTYILSCKENGIARGRQSFIKL